MAKYRVVGQDGYSETIEADKHEWDDDDLVLFIEDNSGSEVDPLPKKRVVAVIRNFLILFLPPE